MFLFSSIHLNIWFLIVHFCCYEWKIKRTIKKQVVCRQNTVSGTAHHHEHNAICQFDLLLFHVQLQKKVQERERPNFPFSICFFYLLCLKNTTSQVNSIGKSSPCKPKEQKAIFNFLEENCINTILCRKHEFNKPQYHHWKQSYLI